MALATQRVAKDLWQMPLDETAGEEEAGGVIASRGQAMSASHKGRIDSDIWAFVKQSAEQLRMLPGMQGLTEAKQILRNSKALVLRGSDPGMSNPPVTGTGKRSSTVGKRIKAASGGQARKRAKK